MLLYICPKCGIWLNYAFTQGLIDVLNKAFKTSQEVEHLCPECKTEMIQPDYRDRLVILPYKGVKAMAMIINDEEKARRN